MSGLRLGVLGSPVRHSLSPVLMSVEPETTDVRLAACSGAHALVMAAEMGLDGMNVTAPFKDLVGLVDIVEPSAEAVGAANTVVWRQGRSHAHNTDVEGVAHALRESGARLRQAAAVVLGAGGAARAAVAALRGEGATVTLAARDTGRAGWFDGEVRGLDEHALDGADIVIDCLSTAERVLPKDVWQPSMTVLVARYAGSAHHDDAVAAGCRVVDGREWLIHQGAAALELFVGHPTSSGCGSTTDAMRAALLAHCPRPTGGHVALIGLMGAGKSTLAPLLGAALGLPVVETDVLVEQRAGCSVAEIFAAEGEEAFRRLETAALTEVLAGPPCVISTGGGIVTSPETPAILGTATTVWLWCAPATAALRTGADPSRPLLAAVDPADRLRVLLAERYDDYARACDVVVDTGRMNPTEAVARIVAELDHPLPTLPAPGSKSVAQRALLLAATADAPTTLTGVTRCDDVEACARLVEALGASVAWHGDTVTILPRSGPRACTADVGESGTALRLGAAVAALGCEPVTLTTAGTLRQRPQGMLVAALETAGARVHTAAGAITVTGPFQPGEHILDGALSSQPLSGLLLALAQVGGPSTLHVAQPASIGYLHLTADVATAFGLNIQVSPDGCRLDVAGRQVPHRDEPYRVEGDWSAAAFLLVAGSLARGVTVMGLNPSSRQADVVVLDALRAAGVGVHVDRDAITVIPGPLRSFSLDATHAPDVVPPLVALATACPGTTTITGARRLRAKESDRGVVLREQLGRLGAVIDLDDDILTVTGSPLHGGTVDPHGDHRIAMAAAVAGLWANGSVVITEPDVVAKSYPDFFTDLERIGP